MGKTHTKVRQGRHGKSTLYPNAEWGTPLTYRPDLHDPKWDEKVGGLVFPPDSSTPHAFIVTPADVKGMIVGARHWQDNPCPRHPWEIVTGLSANPFGVEIEHKVYLTGNCRICDYESGMDI